MDGRLNNLRVHLLGTGLPLKQTDWTSRRQSD